MTDKKNKDPGQHGQPTPPAPFRPKRGAFPTPKEEIERARPYSPDADQADAIPPVDPTAPKDEGIED
jgi:hypothetical protein